jgi:hypothetical protein
MEDKLLNMGIDINIYRSRIGHYYLSKLRSKLKLRQCKTKCKIQEHEDNIYFNLYTALCLGLVLSTTIFIAMHICGRLLYYTDNPVTENKLNIYSDFQLAEIKDTTLRKVHAVGPLSYLSSTADYIRLRLLLLAGDVELNPGPGPSNQGCDNKDVNLGDLMNALKSFEQRTSISEERLLNEMKAVRSDVNSIKNEIAQIKTDCSQTREILNEVISEQATMKIELMNNRDEMNDVQSICENLQLDVNSINDSCERQRDLSEVLNERLEHIERDLIKNRARIFGLEDRQNETYEELKEKVLKQVLRVACPCYGFSLDDIKYVQRVGEYKENSNRMVLLTFRYDDDKYVMYKGRDELRYKGLRVGDDLTKTQRDKLKTAKAMGVNGYFYKGKFCERPNQQNKPTGKDEEQYQTRVFKKAFRTFPREQPLDTITESQVEITNEMEISEATISGNQD